MEPRFRDFAPALLSAGAAVLCSCGGDRLNGPNQVEQVPRQLAFLEQPTKTMLGLPISPAVRVVILDQLGHPVSNAVQDVDLDITRDTSLWGSAGLLGRTTTTAENGLAVFEELSVDRVGAGYTLVANSDNLIQATSNPFDVVVELVSVSAGASHTCGIMSTGGAACWGVNPPLSSATPSVVPGDVQFAALKAGPGVSCGVTTDGEGYCWGSNHFGQIGDGTTDDATEPTAVAGGLTFQTISSGGGHSCGLTTAGTAYCWGAEGLLGNGTETGSRTPVAVSGGIAFDTLDVGFGGGGVRSSTCALTSSGSAYCWGPNSFGQLGDNTTTDRNAPVSVVGGLTFHAIAVGAIHACAMTQDGATYCWGLNTGDRLGLGFPAGPDDCFTTPCSKIPRAITGGLTFTSITAGHSHTCGLTLGGAAYCWGSNREGALGDGTTDDRSTPTKVSGALSFRSISAGLTHTCGVATDSVVYCWGSYWSVLVDPLGIGEDYALVPTPVLGQY
jgi:alpha-tubulin suppressor-like RCC1 family protein